MTWTERRQRKPRGNRHTAGDRESGRIWEGGKGRRDGGPEAPSDGNNSTLNIKGQSLGISQADVRGIGTKPPYNGSAWRSWWPDLQTDRQIYFRVSFRQGLLMSSDNMVTSETLLGYGIK